MLPIVDDHFALWDRHACNTWRSPPAVTKAFRQKRRKKDKGADSYLQEGREKRSRKEAHPGQTAMRPGIDLRAGDVKQVGVLHVFLVKVCTARNVDHRRSAPKRVQVIELLSAFISVLASKPRDTPSSLKGFQIFPDGHRRAWHSKSAAYLFLSSRFPGLPSLSNPLLCRPC